MILMVTVFLLFNYKQQPSRQLQRRLATQINRFGTGLGFLHNHRFQIGITFLRPERHGSGKKGGYHHQPFLHKKFLYQALNINPANGEKTITDSS